MPTVPGAHFFNQPHHKNQKERNRNEQRERKKQQPCSPQPLVSPLPSQGVCLCGVGGAHPGLRAGSQSGLLGRQLSFTSCPTQNRGEMSSGTRGGRVKVGGGQGPL